MRNQVQNDIIYKNINAKEMGDNILSRVFISYSWEDEIHKHWVCDLAGKLRRDGIDVILDQWHLNLGESLPKFMETSINESDYILIICTPAYKTKADSRAGGVGYEENIITGKAFYDNNSTKFIPILRRGKWKEAAPLWLSGRVYEDLSGNPYSEDNYLNLLRTLHNYSKKVPPVGKIPIDRLIKSNFSIGERNDIKSVVYNGNDNLSESYVINVSVESVDAIMFSIKNADTVSECKSLEYKLSRLNSEKEKERVKYYLFNGNKRQCNYAANYFKRKGYHSLLKKAYDEGKIDKIQAFSK